MLCSVRFVNNGCSRDSAEQKELNGTGPQSVLQISDSTQSFTLMDVIWGVWRKKKDKELIKGRRHNIQDSVLLWLFFHCLSYSAVLCSLKGAA